MKITIEKLKRLGPCEEVFRWFVQNNIDNLDQFLELCIRDSHLNWGSWLIVKLMDDNQALSYVIYAARQVWHNFENFFPDDDRPRKSMATVENLLKSLSNVNRAAAWSVSEAAAESARSKIMIKILEHGVKILKKGRVK